MKIKVEYYGNKIGVKDNITECLTKKEFKILLTIKDENDQFKSETIIGKEEASHLIEALSKLLNHPDLDKLGAKVV